MELLMGGTQWVQRKSGVSECLIVVSATDAAGMDGITLSHGPVGADLVCFPRRFEFRGATRGRRGGSTARLPPSSPSARLLGVMGSSGPGYFKPACPFDMSLFFQPSHISQHDSHEGCLKTGVCDSVGSPEQHGG